MRSSAAQALRDMLSEHGLLPGLWPEWVDTRPGLLDTIWVCDEDEPLFWNMHEFLCQRFGPQLLDGLAVLKLAAGARAIGFATSDLRFCDVLRRLVVDTALDVRKIKDLYPLFPELELGQLAGKSIMVSPLMTAQIGALVHKKKLPRLCLVKGAVLAPQVVMNEPDENGKDPPFTARELVRRCGGTRKPAWVALAGRSLGTVRPVEADVPLPDNVSQLWVLPAEHEQVIRHKLMQTPFVRMKNVCEHCTSCSSFCPVELEPHLALRELVRKDLDTIDLPGCIGCGACSVACPNELLPHAVLNPLPLEDKEGRIVTLPVRMPARLVLARLGIDSWARAR
jgi:ferredoxin